MFLVYATIHDPILRRLETALCLAFFLGVAQAHDIPADVRVQVFLKPEGHRLRLLVRAPLAAMRDVDLPVSAEGYLDLERVRPLLTDAAMLWIADSIALYENGERLRQPTSISTRISLPSDRSFAAFESAAALFRGPPLADATKVIWNQTVLDSWFEYTIRSDKSEFEVRSGLARLGQTVSTTLRLVTPEGAVRAFEFTGDPGLLRLDPRWYQAALRFVWSGFLHILDGTDHLLFLLCLVIPFRRFRLLLAVVTAFTVAHSITLIASAYNLGPDALWFPPLIEMLIAVSIVYMALENIAAGAAVKRRWMVAFGFGLVHGFGFSFALRETLQFAGSHLLVSLLSFNVGVELGQILMLCVFMLMLEGLFRFVVAERIGTILVSALVAHTGWHWMVERWDHLRQYRIGLPDVSVIAMIVAGAALLCIAIVWPRLAGVARRLGMPRATPSSEVAETLATVPLEYKRPAGVEPGAETRNLFRS